MEKTGEHQPPSASSIKQAATQSQGRNDHDDNNCNPQEQNQQHANKEQDTSHYDASDEWDDDEDKHHHELHELNGEFEEHCVAFELTPCDQRVATTPKKSFPKESARGQPNRFPVSILKKSNTTRSSVRRKRVSFAEDRGDFPIWFRYSPDAACIGLFRSITTSSLKRRTAIIIPDDQSSSDNDPLKQQPKPILGRKPRNHDRN